MIMDYDRPYAESGQASTSLSTLDGHVAESHQNIKLESAGRGTILISTIHSSSQDDQTFRSDGVSSMIPNDNQMSSTSIGRTAQAHMGGLEAPFVPETIGDHASAAVPVGDGSSVHHIDTQTLRYAPTFDVQVGFSTHSRNSSCASSTFFDDRLGTPGEPFSNPPAPYMSYEFDIIAALHRNDTQNMRPQLGSVLDGKGRIGRSRADSRPMPYNRGARSESISVVSEADEDKVTLLSASSSASGFVSTWHPSNASGLSSTLGNISLQHRRASSNVSSTSQMMHLSFGLGGNTVEPLRGLRTSTAPDAFRCLEPGQATTLADSEVAVRKDLADLAASIKTLPTVSQQDRARSMWIKRWLLLSYTRVPESTVPRQGLYSSYSKSCEEFGLKAVNSASFGKAVRGTFPGIKTRRLGVRGNSKYHYVSIRPAIAIEAERLNSFGDSSGHWHIAPQDGALVFRPAAGHQYNLPSDYADDSEKESDISDNESLPQERSVSSVDLSSMAVDDMMPRLTHARRHTTSVIQPSPAQHHWGFPCTPTLLHLPIISLTSIPPIETPFVQRLWETLCLELNAAAAALDNLDFHRFSALFQQTLRVAASRLSTQRYTGIDHIILQAVAMTLEQSLALMSLKLSTCPARLDVASLRDLVQELSLSVRECVTAYPQPLAGDLLDIVACFEHSLNRIAGLQQVTMAVLPILDNAEQLHTMLQSLDATDIPGLSRHCALVYKTEPETIEVIMSGFRQWLCGVLAAAPAAVSSLDGLRQWLDSTCTRLRHGSLGCAAVTSSVMATACAFLTSQVMRELTIQSAATFGLFQLLKTWIDDWVALSALRQRFGDCQYTAGDTRPPRRNTPALSHSLPLHLDLVTHDTAGLVAPFGSDLTMVVTPRAFFAPAS